MGERGKMQMKDKKVIAAWYHIAVEKVKQLMESLEEKTLENSELSHQNNQMSQAIGEISHDRAIYMKMNYEKDNRIEELVRELERVLNKKEDLRLFSEKSIFEERKKNKEFVKENERLLMENREFSAENKRLIKDNEKLNKQYQVNKNNGKYYCKRRRDYYWKCDSCIGECKHPHSTCFKCQGRGWGDGRSWED